MFKKGIPGHVFFIVALAILMRAVIPAGYMPDLQSTKAFQMVICTADGARTVDADGAFDPTHKTSSMTKLCDFGLTQINGMTVFAELVVAMLILFAVAYLVSRKEFILSRRKHSPVSARAPPIPV